MRPTLGFVGLGNIGAPICWHLLARGYDVHIYDVNPQAIERIRTSRAELPASLPELASSVDVVLLSLPNSATVEQVVHSEAGLERGFSLGNVLIDTSSSRPSSTRHIAAYLA